jgi:DNA-binding NarL/FixJ family response regulator
MSESAKTLPIPVTQEMFDRGMQLARLRVGQANFSARWAEGQAMSLDTAIEEALTVELPTRSESPLRLTAREVEVLRHVASGHTTREIAAKLVVSVATVDRHITHIYQKIGRRGRAAAAAFALESGLLVEGSPV